MMIDFIKLLLGTCSCQADLPQEPGLQKLFILSMGIKKKT